MHIEPLSHETLDDAINLVNKVFPHQRLFERASIGFRGSLAKNSWLYRILFYLAGIAEANYWIAIDDDSKKVIGTTGLYSTRKDEGEAYWLGWTCVEPACRGQGIGSKLVDFAIEKARGAGKKFLRLYTSTNPSQATAQILYEKRGFRITGEEKLRGTEFKILYRELEL